MAAVLIPIELPVSRAYLSLAHQEHLFGKAHEMRILRPRKGCKGQFVYKETVRVLGRGESSIHVPIFGPPWEETRIELTPKDAKTLEVKTGATLQGGVGVVRLKRGVAVPGSSLFCSPDEAKRLQLRHGEQVELCLADRPTIVFEHAEVRVHPTYSLLFEPSPEDANAVEIRQGDTVQLVIS